MTPIVKQTALSVGSGGLESLFELKDNKLCEKPKSNNTSAYMLIYIREEERKELMKEINISDIPPHLKQQFDEENALMRKIIHD